MASPGQELVPVGDQRWPGFPSTSPERLLRPHGDSGGTFPWRALAALGTRSFGVRKGLGTSVYHRFCLWGRSLWHGAQEFSLFVSASSQGQSRLHSGACRPGAGSGLLNRTHLFVCSSVPESRQARFGSGVINPACRTGTSAPPLPLGFSLGLS